MKEQRTRIATWNTCHITCRLSCRHTFPRTTAKLGNKPICRGQGLPTYTHNTHTTAWKAPRVIPTTQCYLLISASAIALVSRTEDGGWPRLFAAASSDTSYVVQRAKHRSRNHRGLHPGRITSSTMATSSYIEDRPVSLASEFRDRCDSSRESGATTSKSA